MQHSGSLASSSCHVCRLILQRLGAGREALDFFSYLGGPELGPRWSLHYDKQ